MDNIIRCIKRAFYVYEPNHEYLVDRNKIKIPAYYKKTRVGEKKWRHKLDYWRQTGEFESAILLDKNFNLVDGFSSCKIAYLNDIPKVPVYFVEVSHEKNYIYDRNTDS